MENLDLNLTDYIQYIIEKDVLKADMYDYVLKNGQSNIVKLNYILKDINKILFFRHYKFLEEQEGHIKNMINWKQKRGYDLPIKKQWTLEEHLEYIKSNPSFQSCNEKQKNNRIKWIEEHHRDITIDKEKLAGYDWEYHSVRILRECVCEEIDRLNQQSGIRLKQSEQYINSTELLSKNLTDFLEEVKQDLKNLKYNLKLADLSVITYRDIICFLQRISNNFEDENLMIVYDDICRWEFAISNDEDKLPYVTKQIKQAIELKIYDNTYLRTSEALKADKNYIDTDFEGKEFKRLYFCEKLPMYLAKSYEAYSDAKTDFTPFSDTETPQQIQLPEILLTWLQETKCTNGKTYIESAIEKPLKWLQNKQLLREMLTHDKIKGTLSIAEIERQTPNLFIDEHNRSLSLANNKPVPSTDSDNLKKNLATL
jgi:hypothetical protein